MKIYQVRKGFACNSSSSHSLLIGAGGKSAEDYLVESGEFGWENFVCKSPGAKRLYLATLLKTNASPAMGEENAVALTKGVLGEACFAGADPEGTYIDHQSVLCLPHARNSRGVDLDFFRALCNFVMQDDVAVLGGNDNIDGSRGIILPIPRDEGTDHGWVARNDKTHWVMFDRRRGTKIRFNFDPSVKVPSRGASPELVDLKITNCCPRGCPYCYQDSKPDGLHADENRIGQVLTAIMDTGVFEVAIGGGEPTVYPKLRDIISHAKWRGIVLNLSTRNVDWLFDVKNLGAIAVSVDCADEVYRLADALRAARKSTDRVSVQYVVGSQVFMTGLVVQACAREGIRCTLLGWKRAGRAGDPKPDDWVGALQCLGRDKCGQLAVDTVLAREGAMDLEERGFARWSFETEEGRFSMYIDAVAGKMGPSSYCSPEKMIPIDWDEDVKAQIRKAFEEFANR